MISVEEANLAEAVVVHARHFSDEKKRNLSRQDGVSDLRSAKSDEFRTIGQPPVGNKRDRDVLTRARVANQDRELGGWAEPVKIGHGLAIPVQKEPGKGGALLQGKGNGDLVLRPARPASAWILVDGIQDRMRCIEST